MQLLYQKFTTPIIMDNDEESNHTSDLFHLEDNLDSVKIPYLLDRTIFGEIRTVDLDGNAAIRDMVEKIETYKNNLSTSRTGSST